MLDPNTTSPVVDPVQQDSGTNLAEHFLCFELSGERYGITRSFVREVLRWSEPYPVWNVPSFIRGAIFDKNQFVPVVDLRIVFKQRVRVSDQGSNIIVLEMEYKNRLAVFGFQVDRVIGTEKIESSSIGEAGSYDQDARSPFITGIARKDDRTILLINLGDLLGDRDLH